jgi:hypothetical protein
MVTVKLVTMRVLVGARGFEPRTSRSRSVRAAELRYAPNAPPSMALLLYLNQIVWQLDTH